MTVKKKCPRCGKMSLRRAGHTVHGKVKWTCRETTGARQLCYTTSFPDSPGVVKQDGSTAKPGKAPVFKRALDSKRYIITAAQNGTPVHKNFFASLLSYARIMDAELVVIPLRYKNPTSTWTASQQNEETWASEVRPYLYNARKALNNNVTLFGDIKTQPTASDPLSSFEAISHGESCIIGHTKLQMKVVPTPQHKFPKILTTTGACTKANYTDSKAGKLGEFHHALAAVVVEIKDSKTFHLRHINGHKETGEFTDLMRKFDPTGFTVAPQPLALIMGDTHVDFIDPKVEQATFGKDGIIEALNPKTLVWHDLLDAYAVNPHHRGNPFNMIAKRESGRDDVKAEVLRAIKFVADRTPDGKRESVIVSSNHDDFLARWVRDTDWRFDPTNAEFYLRTALELKRRTKMGPSGTSYPSPFGYWLEQWGRPNIRVLARAESFAPGGVELGMHGDVGPGGARGSIRNLRRIGVRSVIGHSHSPAINEGCYQVGTSTSLRLEYNLGPSGWLNTHCILHADGKRQLINIINGDWRL